MEERFRNLDYQNWKPVRTLGTDSYGTVYEIARDDGFGMVDHAALKVLSIPAAPEDFDALVAEGRTPEEVTALLHRQVETIARQLMAVDAISDEPNLLRCEDHVIREHPDGRGWDIYVRTELLPSLPDYLRNHPHGEADIIRLGAGLCSALETCHRRGIVHGDIKPRNVFVGGGNFNEQVTYKLGDFGMAQFSAVDNTNDFMAPEVLCGAEVSPESDLYSVGMVLYWALNERRIPFVPLPPTAVEASDLAIAREQRLRGDPLPEPLHGSQALKNVVMRACADDPAQRYASVEEFRAALLAVARRAAAAQPQQAQAVRREAPAPKAVAADTFPGSKPKAQRKAVPVESEGAEKPHNAKKTIAIVLGSLVVVALVVLIIVMALQGGKSGVDSITLDHESAEIAPQDTLTLKATVLDASGQELTDETLTWSSSNAAVATVKDGVVTGVTEGKAKITVKAGKRSADCTITVTNDAIEVKSLKLDKDRAEMQIGDSLTLTATMQPANAPDDLVSWASSDPNIATVKKGHRRGDELRLRDDHGLRRQLHRHVPDHGAGTVARRQRHGRDSFGHARSRRHEDRHHHVPHPRAESRQPAGFREDLRGRRQRRLARPAGAHRQRHGRYLQRHGHGRRCRLHQRDPADHRRRRHDALRRLHRHRQGEQDHPGPDPRRERITQTVTRPAGRFALPAVFKLRLRPRYDLFHPVPYPDGVRSGEQATPFPHCAGTKKPLFLPYLSCISPSTRPGCTSVQPGLVRSDSVFPLSRCGCPPRSRRPRAVHGRDHLLRDRHRPGSPAATTRDNRQRN